jgi:hypothetical protein
VGIPYLYCKAKLCRDAEGVTGIGSECIDNLPYQPTQGRAKLCYIYDNGVLLPGSPYHSYKSGAKGLTELLKKENDKSKGIDNSTLTLYANT